MSEFNPYAAPRSEISSGPRPSDESGVWRDEHLLVMTKDAELPDRCLKCNSPAHGYKLKRSLMWHPSYWYLLVLFNLLIYLVVALIVRQTAKVWIPLCEVHRSRRRRAIAGGWFFSLLGIAVIVAGAASALPDYEGPVVVGGVVLLLGGLLYGIIGAQVAVPQKIDKRYVWLKKVSPEFLAELPPWVPDTMTPVR